MVTVTVSDTGKEFLGRIAEYLSTVLYDQGNGTGLGSRWRAEL